MLAQYPSLDGNPAVMGFHVCHTFLHAVLYVILQLVHVRMCTRAVLALTVCMALSAPCTRQPGRLVTGSGVVNNVVKTLLPMCSITNLSEEQ